MAKKPRETLTIYASVAGICSSAGSLFGKLAGMPFHPILRCGCFVFMVTFNAAVWTFFVKALQKSKSSLTATVLSAATNYIFSAILGFTLFGEVTSALWWLGTLFVMMGLVLISRSQKNTQPGINSKES